MVFKRLKERFSRRKADPKVVKAAEETETAPVKAVEEVVKTESVEPTPEAPDEARELEATPDPEETPKEEEEAESPKENVESSAEEAKEAIADTNAQKEAFSCCGIAGQ